MRYPQKRGVKKKIGEAALDVAVSRRVKTTYLEDKRASLRDQGHVD